MESIPILQGNRILNIKIDHYTICMEYLQNIKISSI